MNIYIYSFSQVPYLTEPVRNRKKRDSILQKQYEHKYSRIKINRKWENLYKESKVILTKS